MPISLGIGPAVTRAQSPGGVPENALLDEAGEPILDEAGDYILDES